MKRTVTVNMMPTGRVYTYPEVRKLLEDQRKRMIEEVDKKQDVIRDAMVYDEILTNMYIHLETLRRMGFQRGALENFILRVAEVSDEINSDQLDYADLEKGIDDLLGYHLKDEGLYQDLKERAERK